VRQGHRVGILAATHSHLRPQAPAAGFERIDGIEYRWLQTPPYAGNGLGRARNILSFLSQASSLAPQIVGAMKPHAVIASSTYPMDHWPARRIAKLAGAVLVHEIHDLWPLSPIELSGMSPWHPFALVCQSAENAAYRHSDLIVSMLPKVHDHLRAHGGDPARLHIVPNGIHPDDWQGEAPPLRADLAEAVRAAREKQAVIVVYAGAMGDSNALDDLLDAAALLRDRPLHFVLVGDGPLKARLAQRIAAEGLDRVRCFDPIPKAEVRSLLAAADVAYLGWQKKPIYRFGIAANKLLDYMMAGKPVLHAAAAGNDPVAEAGCGLTVEPASPEAIARGLRQLAALQPKERRVLGDKGRAFVMKHHAWPTLARRFADAIEAVRGERA
jgi:glycosyltransferase involved in cell wall biosynthesis